MKKKTLILGASTKPERYSFKAAQMLNDHKHPIVLSGLREGVVCGQAIHLIQNREMFEDVDTITLYVSAKNQLDLMDYLIGLRPKRVIFNPGTENPEFYKKLERNGIDYLEACTLVLLRTDQY